MPQPNFTIVYGDNHAASGAFYGDRLALQPVEASPTFVLFALDSGLMLGLWSRHTVEPPATFSGTSAELGFVAGGDAELDAIWRDWRNRGVTILQEPVALDFGGSFVAVAPHGHRLLVFVPAQR